MGLRSWRAVAGLAGLAVALGATGCTSKAKPIIPAPVVSESSSSTAAATPTVGPTPTVTQQSASPFVSASPSAPVLPAGCSQLLPLATLERILGFGILGQVNYLKAAPVPQSGRTGRVTCTYGTAPGAPSPTAETPSPTPTKSGAKPTAAPATPATPAPVPLVEVSYITYVDASTAAGRVQTTIEADAENATVSNVSVSGKPAFILIGSTSSELVMSDLARTIVVVLSPSLVTSDKAPAALEGIAAAMLRFGSPGSPSTSPSAGGSA